MQQLSVQLTLGKLSHRLFPQNILYFPFNTGSKPVTVFTADHHPKCKYKPWSTKLSIGKLPNSVFLTDLITLHQLQSMCGAFLPMRLRKRNPVLQWRRKATHVIWRKVDLGLQDRNLIGPLVCCIPIRFPRFGNIATLINYLFVWAKWISISHTLRVYILKCSVLYLCRAKSTWVWGS